MTPTDDMNETAIEEGLLLDLLYGELEGDAAASAQSRIESDDALSEELDGLRSMRELFASLPDEEPPAAISAQLLHAAAAAARPAKASTSEETGFFAWFRNLFGPVMRYPGLAAAASLVLVMGIAGAVYVSGGTQTAQPSTTSNEAMPMQPAGTTTTTTGADGDKEAAPEARPDNSIPPAGPQAGYADDLTNRRAANDPAPATEESAKPKRSARKSAPRKTGLETKGGSKSKLRPSFSSSPPPAPAPPPASKAPAQPTDKGPSVRGRSEGGGVVVDTKNDPAPKSPSPQKKSDEKKSRSDQGGAQQTKQRAKKVQAALALHAKARLAAKRGDCRTVHTITAQVRKLDSRYYDTKYLADAQLRACLRAKPAVKK